MGKCRWCEREGQWPLICMSSRDMEDCACEGNDQCWQALVEIGGGEKGLAYVAANRRAPP